MTLHREMHAHGRDRCSCPSSRNASGSNRFISFDDASRTCTGRFLLVRGVSFSYLSVTLHAGASP